jgi:argininosuccinate lyase
MSAFFAEKGPTGMGVFSRNFYVKPALLRSFDNIVRDLRWFTAMIPALKVDKKRMEEMAGSFWATASEVAELIVREKGLSWRTAHQIVGILVRISRERGVGPAEVDSGLLDEAAVTYFEKPLHLDEGSLRNALDPGRFVIARTLHGGPAPVESTRRIRRFREGLKRDRKAVLDMQKRLREAAEELERAVEAIILNAHEAETAVHGPVPLSCRGLNSNKEKNRVRNRN